MSNRFHNKWHRRNHHTYGNNSNPDACHDPIASPQQPFLGDFSLSGSLSAVAPLSAFAAYLYTNNTGLCSYAGRVGAFINSYGYMGANIQSNVYGVSAYAPFVGIAATSPFIGLSAYGGYTAIRAFSPNRGVSAYGGGVGGVFGSLLVGLSANGGLIGTQVYSPRTAVSAYGSRLGMEVYSDNLCLSGYSPLTGVKVEAGLVGGQFRSRVISLSTGGGGINIFNSRTGIYKEPKDYYGNPQQQSGQIVLDVGGDVWIDGACTIMGDLSAYGTITYLDTKVSVTSSFLVNNKGTDAAATIIQTGNQPILRCFDQDIDTPLATPSFIVDGATNGWVGIGVATPTAPFNIVKNSSTTQLGNANQPHIRIYDGATNGVILGTYGTNNGGTNPGGTTNPYIGTENSVPFDILTNNDARITVLANGNVGINDTRATTKLSVYSNDATSNNIAISAYAPSVGAMLYSNSTALSTWGGSYGAIIAGGTTRINYDGGGSTYINTNNTVATNIGIGNTSATLTTLGTTTINQNAGTNTTGIGTGTTTGAITIGNTGLTGGVTIAGSPVNINASAGAYATNIGTGTTTGNVTIGNTTNAGTGYVGIGVAPQCRLEISNRPTIPSTVSANGTVVHVTQVDNTSNRLLLDAFSSTSSSARSSFTGRTAGGSLSVPAGTPADCVLCEITGMGHNGTAYSSTSLGRMTINAAETWAGTSQGTYLTFQTSTIGTNAATERVRITDSGNVLIGSPFTGTSKLTVTGSVYTSSGDVTLAATSGNVTIGTSGATVGINGTVTIAGGININNTTAQTANINTGTGAVTTTIGNTSSTVAINGTTNITGTTTVTGAANINSGTSTTANVNINTGSTTSSSTTNIHTGAITGALTLGNTSATSTLAGSLVSVNGPFASRTPFSTSGTVDISAQTTNSIICTAASTLTLPSASTNSGRWIYIKATGNFAVSSASANITTFAGTASQTTIIAATASGRWAWLQSDGSQWVIMATAAA